MLKGTHTEQDASQLEETVLTARQRRRTLEDEPRSSLLVLLLSLRNWQDMVGFKGMAGVETTQDITHQETTSLELRSQNDHRRFDSQVNVSAPQYTNRSEVIKDQVF